jgi:hypothetical protein
MLYAAPFDESNCSTEFEPTPGLVLKLAPENVPETDRRIRLSNELHPVNQVIEIYFSGLALTFSKTPNRAYE